MVLLLLLAYLIVRMPSVQTYICKKIAANLSEKVGSRIEVGGVDIDFFSNLVLEKVYVEDRQKDTLLYIGRLGVGIGVFDIRAHRIDLSEISLSNANVYLVRHTADTLWNYDYVINAFIAKDTVTSTNAPWEVNFGDINLTNITFAYRDERDTVHSLSIDYEDIYATNVNAKLKNLKFDQDTISVNIKSLTARERSGIVIRSMRTDFQISPLFTKYHNLHLETNASIVETDLIFKYKEYSDYLDFNHRVRMEANFDKSVIQMSDIGYFADALMGFKAKLIVSGQFKGLVDHLSGKKMDISYGTSSHFKGDFELTGLPNIEETYMNFSIKELSTTKADIEHIPLPPFNQPSYLKLSPNIALLGKAKFKGKLVGYYYNMVANGSFVTDLGNIGSDLLFKQDVKTGLISYGGRLKANKFNIGKLIDQENNFGYITMDADITGRGIKLDDLHATLNKCSIDEFQFNNYTYRAINVTGELAKRVFNGTLTVDDENLTMDFNGNADFSKSPTQLDFTSKISKMNLVPLNYYKTDKDIRLSAVIDCNLTGDNLDNVKGKLVVNELFYLQDKDTFSAKSSVFTSDEIAGQKNMQLKSDFADVTVKGIFRPQELSYSFNSLIKQFLPSLNPAFNRKKITQDFVYQINLKKVNDLTHLFFPAFSIADNTVITGNYRSELDEAKVTIDTDSLSIHGTLLKNINLNIATVNGKLITTTNCKHYMIGDTIWASNLKLQANAFNDSINYQLLWKNEGKLINSGNLNGLVAFNKLEQTHLKIYPSELILRDSVWTVKKDNLVIIDSSSITVNELEFSNKGQKINLGGKTKNGTNDQLKLTLTQFNLANINMFTSRLGLTFSGEVSGVSYVSNLYQKNNLIFGSDLTFNRMNLNNQDFGTGAVLCTYNKSIEAISLNGNFINGPIPNLVFSGYYYPKEKENSIDLVVDVNNFSLDFFEPFTKDICSVMKGFLSAKLKIKGNPDNPLISGEANVIAKNIMVDYLNTNYSFNGPIKIENESFSVEKLIANDQNGQQATITGKVTHKKFSNIYLDFSVDARKFMCLNTREADNSLYYGNAFVTGNIKLYGAIDNLEIDAVVRTEKVKYGGTTDYTQFFIPLSRPLDATSSDFITFVNKKADTLKINNVYKPKLNGLKLNFEIEATPDAEVQIVFDQKVGDVIRAKGNGNLQLRINTNGDFLMYGGYEIVEGDYLFTLNNLFINKRFKLEQGGTIKWSGSPYHADLNLRAIYSLRTSLAPILISDSANKKRVPVDVVLQLKGDMLQPDISFDVELPTVDDTRRQEVKSYLNDGIANNEQEVNKQVFSLLMLNTFVPPSTMQGGAAGKNVVTGGGAASSTELLTSQFNNWLSQVTKSIDIGVHYRPGSAISKDELEVALSKQLFNNKLALDGSVANNSNISAVNPNAVVGDVNAEYKLTNDGKVRLKAFYKTNDNMVINPQAAYTQGFGVFFREEFETLGGLYRRYRAMLKPKKAQEVTK